MDKYSWIIRFEGKDENPNMEICFNDEDSARDAFSFQDTPDNAETYATINLIKRDWNERRDYILDGISF